MEEIERNVIFAFEKVEGFNRVRKEKIKIYEQELKERFLTNLMVHVQAKKKKLQDDQDKENESSAETSTASVSKQARREEQNALLPSDKENDSSIDSNSSKSSRRARRGEANPEPEFVTPALRPVRTAKINANKHLREPDLGKKMRQPGSMEKVQEIKEEPVEQPSIKRETRTKKKIKQEKTSLMPPPSVEDTVQRKSKDGEEKDNTSVELVASRDAEIVVLSDGEGEKMPPPAIPAPKTRRARTKKKTSNVQVERPINESMIKKEKIPIPETSSARSSRKASGESQYEDALTGETEERAVVEPVPKSPIPMNATFDVAKEKEPEPQPEPEAPPLNSSLMTEDNSIEVPIEAPKKVMKKKPHPIELFNPCVQSPLRTKVEAFERHAAASGLPIAKGTPSHVSRAPRLMEKSASTSKLSHNVSGAKKKSKGGLTQSATKATTRSASAEDNKRGLNALQLLAEEKRKKREERHKLAQQAREAREREKEERNRRLMLEQQEREEKIRQERFKATKAKQLQEQEQKQRLEELQRSAQKSRTAKGKQTPKWGFDMLCSDDSTDDEGKPSKKRPAAPTWCVNPCRSAQICTLVRIKPRHLDKFYMIRPMSVNLKEIFPDIDPRNLHRNSSVVWKTPPRFSQTPKSK